ncbi:hypothetical protein BCR34DRAFT_95278 [Clohesyomyces aquaticus]|uniref:Uncharacterized protein n=1 Tax=Clohesyomyces aquaticus TaxID=1231657 RepID=A0A1Y2A1Y9_9PLEO|nr:hypothetical protein BCR34DRAFT_95278 [Clohesyomyces aquaticus]
MLKLLAVTKGMKGGGFDSFLCRLQEGSGSVWVRREDDQLRAESTCWASVHARRGRWFRRRAVEDADQTPGRPIPPILEDKSTTDALNQGTLCACATPLWPAARHSHAPSASPIPGPSTWSGINTAAVSTTCTQHDPHMLFFWMPSRPAPLLSLRRRDNGVIFLNKTRSLFRPIRLADRRAREQCSAAAELCAEPGFGCCSVPRAALPPFTPSNGSAFKKQARRSCSAGPSPPPAIHAGSRGSAGVPVSKSGVYLCNVGAHRIVVPHCRLLIARVLPSSHLFITRRSLSRRPLEGCPRLSKAGGPAVDSVCHPAWRVLRSRLVRPARSGTPWPSHGAQGLCYCWIQPLPRRRPPRTPENTNPHLSEVWQTGRDRHGEDVRDRHAEHIRMSSQQRASASVCCA